ncbi:MAG TPA: hypothetical protein VJ890_15195 [Vineibacter sp.]|nr:hypothetical protein [Vineibacter sp.]
MRKILLSVAVLAITLATGPVRAEILQRYNTGNWVIDANADRGTFQNCTATGQYGGGAAVMFMLTRDVVWGMAITNPKWNWRSGSEGAVSYRIDSFAQRNGRARAMTATQLLIPLADSQSLFHEIRQGNNMYFNPQGAEGFSITLIGTSVALTELMSCVRRYR